MKTKEQARRSGVAVTMLVLSLLGGSAAAQSAAPVVKIAATQEATSEPMPNARIIPGEFTISRAHAGSQPLVVFVQHRGSAMPGSDYSELPPQVTIPAGELSATLSVVALSDPNANEGTENVATNLLPPPPGSAAAYTLDPQNWAQVLIHDGPAVPQPPLVTIAGYSVSPERCDDAAVCAGIDFRLTRFGEDMAQPLTVVLHYEGTATAGVDYHALPSSVTFAAGADTAHLLAAPIDDNHVEGDETVIAIIADPPPVTPPTQPAYRHFNTSDRATAVIRDNDGPAPVPTVTIDAGGFPPLTGEPCPTCWVAPVTIEVSRTGPLDHALAVSLRAGGTATQGVDYPSLPDPIMIPAGAASASFSILPLDDSLAEGPEIIEIGLRPSPAGYSVGDPGTVQAVIRDDDPSAPTERVDIVEPASGASFPSGVPAIHVRALGVSTRGEIDRPMDFYANGVFIGKSNPPQYGRPSVPYLPRDHEIEWNAPANGQYVLTARVEFSLNQWVEAPPIPVTVGAVPATSMVSVVATERIAEEDSAPTMRPFIMRGQFTVSRTGPVANEQPVYLHVSGTAMPGTDYRPLPFTLTIPAGAASTTLQVEAIPDNIREPLETVIVEVSNCPPAHLLPPCFDFEVDPAHRRDTVFVRDDGITRATLEITAPAQNAHFAAGQAIPIDALAIDVDGAMTGIDFYAGSQKIGSSVINFIVQPEPGTPIMHHFTWTGAPAGTHHLTTQGTSTHGTPVLSAPVTIIVGGNDNQLPRVALTSPSDGTQFPSGSPVELVAAATDPDGYVNYAEFFANGHKLGDVGLDFLVPPPDGETQTFSFTWRDAPPGSHALTVRVRDDNGAQGVSAPVTITVSAADGLPVIVVWPSDPFGVEPFGGDPADLASFRLRRYGPVANSLAVNYSLAGTATNGTDYTRLTGTAVFPAGASSVDVTVEPLADNVTEGRETVILQVELQFDDGPERYHVGEQRRAIAVIADYFWEPPHPGDLCSSLGGGLFHLCFPATPAAGFRIEASDDLARWETIHEGATPADAVHFIDPNSPGRTHRFYRMAEDPAAGTP